LFPAVFTALFYGVLTMTFGKHFDGFIAYKIEEGRFASASEVVHAALRMFEDNEQKL